MKKLENFIVELIKLSVYAIAIVGVIAFIGESLFPSANSGFIINIGTFIGLVYLFNVYRAFQNTFNTKTINSSTNSISRNENQFKQLFKNTTQSNDSLISSKLKVVEVIEKQYHTGVFTEHEKNELINKLFKEKQNEELEKIKENYKSVLDPFRDKFLDIYSIDSVELEDLHNQGVIDEKTLKSKLNILAVNVAKRIQKEIRFKSTKGFEVYQGLEVKNGNAVGVIVEIINSKEIRAQLNWDNSLTKEWSIIDLTPTGKVNTDLKDWDLDQNNFLLQ